MAAELHRERQAALEAEAQATKERLAEEERRLVAEREAAEKRQAQIDEATFANQQMLNLLAAEQVDRATLEGDIALVEGVRVGEEIFGSMNLAVQSTKTTVLIGLRAKLAALPPPPPVIEVAIPDDTGTVQLVGTVLADGNLSVEARPCDVPEVSTDAVAELLQNPPASEVQPSEPWSREAGEPVPVPFALTYADVVACICERWNVDETTAADALALIDFRSPVFGAECG